MRPVETERRDELQSMRRRLCTMLPLPTMSTPRSRSGASRAPSVEVIVERPCARRCESCRTGMSASGKAWHEHRPGAMVDAPAVVVEPDVRLDDLARSPRRARDRRAPDTRPRTARRGSRRSRGSSAAAPSRSPRWRSRTSAPRPPGSRAGADSITERPPRFGVAVALERVHRAAVAEERRWCAISRAKLLPLRHHDPARNPAPDAPSNRCRSPRGRCRR